MIWNKVGYGFLVIGLLIFLTIVFRMFLYGCVAPIVQTNLSILDNLTCDDLQDLILSNTQIPTTQLLYCTDNRYSRNLTREYQIHIEYFQDKYKEKCMNLKNE